MTMSVITIFTGFSSSHAQAVTAVGRLEDIMSLPRENLAEEVSNLGVVVDYQNGRHR